jgi:hypothetical protein
VKAHRRVVFREARIDNTQIVVGLGKAHLSRTRILDMLNDNF